MVKVDSISTWGFESAVRAMRNPMNSWHKSDSGEGCCVPTNHTKFVRCIDCDMRLNCHTTPYYTLGENDLQLMHKLYSAGVSHRTYARMIFVSMDILAPLYWWKEMDRYTVGKSQVSTSTMHKVHEKPFSLSDFSHENMTSGALNCLLGVIERLNISRMMYVRSDKSEKEYWWDMIQLLPASYNQKRTCCFSYETVFKIIDERKSHKLDEWLEFVEVLRGLPYVVDITKEESR